MMANNNKKLPTKTMLIDGINIAYETYGNGENVILCVHGWLDNAASFARLAHFLTNCTLICIDLPGHGLSDHLPQASYYHFIDGVSHLLKFIDQLSIKNLYLLGHSLGACLASIAACELSHQIKGLILIDAIGPISEDEQNAARNYHRYLSQSKKLEHYQAKCFATLDEAINTRAAKGFIGAEHAHDIVERGIKNTKEGFLWRHDKRLLLASPLRMTEAQILSFLSAIDTKTLLITAKNGFIYDQHKVQGRVNAVKHITQEVIDGGHHIHIEKPQQVAALIGEFLG